MVIHIVYLTSLIGLFAVSSLVFANNPKARINRRFTYFSMNIILWLCCLYLVDSGIIDDYNTTLWIVRFAYFFAAFFVLSLSSFLSVFPDNVEVLGKRQTNTIAILAIILACIALTPYMVISVESQELSVSVKESGILMPVYTLLLFVSVLISSSVLLFKKYQKNHNKISRDQIKLFIAGLLFMSVLNIITNLFLVPFGGSIWGLLIGIPSILVFVVVMAYTIVKHKLFDIRLVVARSLGYLLSVGSLAFLYGLVSFGIIGMIISDNASVNLERMTYTLVAVVLAFTFQPLKRFFDKWSNKVFYRDAYDSQELLDGLNKILVSTIDLNKLLKNSAEVINQSIKAEFVVFGIKRIEDSPQRIIGSAERQFSAQDIEQVRHITSETRQKSIVADELEEGESKLRDLLRKNDIAGLIRLTDTPTKKAEGLGYIVLGNKKSGSPYTKQDIQVLEIIADELVIAIQNALRFEEIQNFNITLQDKVDDATKKLRKANQRLVELDQTKDDFISMASHQLRTPLTSIKGYVSMVMEGDAGKITKKQSELLDQAFVSSQRMVYLIADLLNVSRLRTGKFIIEPKETNLADVIEGEIAQLKETAKGRDLVLVFGKPTSFPNLMLDETKIRQVIMNFADNAIYYTPSGGHIRVALEDKGDTVEFTVTDDGIGVPKAEQHHLFNKFYRAGNAKKARPDGTGLGLFMAKKVVIAQGGSIIFKTQEGKGSTFGFAFTKKPLLPENYKGV